MSKAGNMHWHRRCRLAAVVLGAAIALGTTASLAAAQGDVPETEGKAAPPNAVGISSSWSAETTSTGTISGLLLDDRQLAVVQEISDYFNGIGDLQGKFVQTDAQNQTAKGYFYLKRPGRFRFVYAPPSKLVILSDGRFLSYEDYDLKNVDRYPIDSTPFRVLLQPTVDLARDAHIIDLAEAPDLVSMTMQDRAEDSVGKMRLFFARVDGGIELKEWVIVTPQGGETRVQVAELVRDKPVDPELFKANNALLLPAEKTR